MLPGEIPGSVPDCSEKRCKHRKKHGFLDRDNSLKKIEKNA